MSNGLKFIPSSSATPTTLKSTTGTTAIPAVHDTLAHGLPSTVHTLNSRHPLENRVKNWNGQQDELKMQLAKRLGGIGEVLRIGTERLVVGDDFRPIAIGGPSNLHADIISGRDSRIDIDDIYNDHDLANVPYHTELERRLRI